jgi:hypothetical protein
METWSQLLKNLRDASDDPEQFDQARQACLARVAEVEARKAAKSKFAPKDRTNPSFAKARLRFGW